MSELGHALVWSEVLTQFLESVRLREGLGNSDSVLSGSLASPTPTEVVANQRSEAMKRTRRNHGATFKAQVALAAVQRRQDAGGVGRTISRPSHPDHRMEAAIAGASRGRVWRDQADSGHAGSQDPPRQDWAAGAGE